MAFVLVQPAAASVIQMGVTLVPPEKVTDASFSMNLTILNSGDEAAHDVQASLLLPEGFSSPPLYAGTMEPGRPFNGEFEVTAVESVNPGTYPIVLKTHYTDANAYPFSTVSPSYFRYKTQSPMMVRGQIGDLSLAGQSEKDLAIVFSNLDERPHRVLVRLRLPDEIKASEYSKEIEIGGKEDGKLTIPVKSFGALPGSAYIVFASAEYDDAGIHYSSIASGRVDILGKDAEGFQAPTWLPAAVLGILLVAVIYLQIRK